MENDKKVEKPEKHDLMKDAKTFVELADMNWTLGRNQTIDQCTAYHNQEIAALKARVKDAILNFDTEDFVDEYELRGDNGDYTPNERERFLIIDCGIGLLEAQADKIKKAMDLT